jgi:exonuclease V
VTSALQQVPDVFDSAAALPSVKQDDRSPLERFRTQPKKALSVTDLVSPAWCELQYWYTLAIHGRKPATKAMKKGSEVHKVLEEQVYTTVQVDVQTKEDAWGLRVWNVIQGLKTLQETGQTRELEVWGMVDGQIVNGVIDEVSYICPDTELEEESQRKNGLQHPELPPDQTTLFDYFKASGATSIAGATRKSWTERFEAPSFKLYICDVKTRSVSSLPRGAAFRPTKLQLMLYHHILTALATNQVDLSIIANRHELDIEAPFSDSFIAQVGNLNDDIFFDAPSTPDGNEDEPPNTQESMTMLLSNNSLSQLWSLMILEFQRALPRGADSIGNCLKAEYRSGDTGEIIGSHVFLMDKDVLKLYIDHEMQWWKGQRPAEGVVVEEAYKCRSCEFAEHCDWRLEKIEQARGKARQRKAENEKEGVAP